MKLPLPMRQNKQMINGETTIGEGARNGRLADEIHCLPIFVGDDLIRWAFASNVIF